MLLFTGSGHAVDIQADRACKTGLHLASMALSLNNSAEMLHAFDGLQPGNVITCT